ncbi:MAG: ROK family protein, partial [Pseudomonadota bacterium]
VARLYENVPPMLPKYVFGSECDTPVVQAKHGDSSGVRGAAWLWPEESDQDIRQTDEQRKMHQI